MIGDTYNVDSFMRDVFHWGSLQGLVKSRSQTLGALLFVCLSVSLQEIINYTPGCVSK
jgi:hypothetical protein